MENTVRDAALALKAAIEEATAAGYRVAWPGSAADLDKIAVSETAKVARADALTRPPVSTLTRPLPE